MEHQDYLRSKYFGSLDGLRGVSIVPVVWHHIGGHRGGLLGLGYLGVHLFFAISGFLITTLLLREQEKTGTVSLRNFYIRRTLRIFPLYYAVLALYVVVVAVVERGSPPGRQFFENLPAFLTYTSNWFVELSLGNRVIFYFAWSLATEEQFYLVWPSIVRFARAAWIPPLVMALMLAAGELARWASAAGAWPGDLLVARVISSISSPICLGCLAAYALHRPGLFRITARIAGARWSAPLAAALLLGVLSAIDLVPTLAVSAAMTFLVVTAAIRRDHGLSALLDNRALRYIGSISYGMYLLHMLCINTVHRVLLPHGSELVTFAVALPLTIGAATLSYRLYEDRFLRLKDRFTVPRPAVAAASVARVA